MIKKKDKNVVLPSSNIAMVSGQFDETRKEIKAPRLESRK